MSRLHIILHSATLYCSPIALAISTLTNHEITQNHHYNCFVSSLENNSSDLFVGNWREPTEKHTLSQRFWTLRWPRCRWQDSCRTLQYGQDLTLSRWQSLAPNLAADLHCSRVLVYFQGTRNSAVQRNMLPTVQQLIKWEGEIKERQHAKKVFLLGHTEGNNFFPMFSWRSHPSAPCCGWKNRQILKLFNKDKSVRNYLWIITMRRQCLLEMIHTFYPCPSPASYHPSPVTFSSYSSSYVKNYQPFKPFLQ